ncbi:ATP-binding protein [Chloroflexota bacterium]
MSWIVVGEEKGQIKLVSKTGVDGLLPKGSYLTIEKGETKFILRVDKSYQTEPYAPSPMIIDMDLSGLIQDQKCQNLILAYRVKDISNRQDGKIDFIPPQSIARRSNQEEIDLAMDVDAKGPEVFLATVHAGINQLLMDEKNEYIKTSMPIDMFYHQMLICGKTGSGKTVATKYLAQYFIEELEGVVLAINVKDVDFLKMNRPSLSKNPQVLKEWESLGTGPRGIKNYVVYYPANIDIMSYRDLDVDYFKKVTLSVHSIEPEALTGLLQGISDVGAQNLPDIFRYWQSKVRGKDNTFNDFVSYFIDVGEDGRRFTTLNHRGDESEVPLHPATYNNIQRTLSVANNFFDNSGATILDESDILIKGQMSILNVGNEGLQFGSIMLRHLLHKIVDAKSSGRSNIPVLFIIDEVHNFYNSNASQDALGDLDTICRQGRSQKIGVIFSSQNPNDIPKGLSSVINTKIFFKSDPVTSRTHAINISSDELENLKKGYAVGTIHELSQLRIFKFPMAYAGVFE